MRKRQFLRLMAAMLAVLLLLGTPAALAGNLPDASQGTTGPEKGLPSAQEVLEQCLAAYGGKAADWEELSAIYAALAKGDYTKGVSLEEVTLPALPQEPSSALFQALMTGDLEAARQAAETLVQEGELADPGYGYGYALNLLAAEAWNRSAEVPLSYDRQQAAEKLLGYRYEGGPGYGYSYDGVYSDDFDTAGLALAALTLLDDGEISGLQEAKEALLGWILQKVQQGIGNPNSLALLITGLTAAGQETDAAVEELLGFYLGEGRFESSFLPGEPDAFATKQAVRALSEALDGASFFTSVRLNPAGLQEGAQEEGAQGGTEPGEEPGEEQEPQPVQEFIYLTVTGPEGVLLPRTRLSHADGMTPLDALGQSGLSFVQSGGYVSAIEGIAERDYGVGSGWLFRVNDIYGILQGASQYRLQAEDELVWYYTFDYVEDEGSKDWKEPELPGLTEPVSETVQQAREMLVKALLDTLKEQGPSSVDDLVVFSLARGGDVSQELLQQWYEGFCERAAAADGRLSSSKYTEYSKAVLTLTAAGFDASRAAASQERPEGYDFTEPLTQVDRVSAQGVTGTAYALLALDCGNYRAQQPDALRGQLVASLLDNQLDDGGFALTNDKADAADADVTAIVLSALAPYEQAAQAVQRGLDCLAGMQMESGDFASYGQESCESTAQVIVALCRLGIDAQDARFVKEGGTLTDALLRYQLEDGSFSHTPGGQSDPIATAQALMALTALSCGERGADLFVTFHDIAGVPQREAVEALASAGVLCGMGDGSFCPDAPVTVAQYYTALARAKGLEAEPGQGAWYEGYLEAAAREGLAQPEELADPNAPMTQGQTRAQAAAELYELWKAA